MTNVVKPNEIKRAGDFTVDDCRLILSSGIELDISGVLLEVQLYESIDTSAVTGTVSFANTDGLSNSGPIIGQEYLKLKIRTPTFTNEENIIDFSENVLHVTNVTVSQIGNKGELILMNVITSEAVRNQGAVVSRSVEGTYDEFVRALLKNDLKCTKKLDIESAAGRRKYVLPNTNPFDLIKIFRRKAVSAATNSPTYVFFENFRGYHFKTLEKMYGQEPVMTYFESSFGVDTGDKTQENPKKRLERELSTIQAASIVNRKDTLVNMSLGALSSELTTFDVVTKQFNGGNGPETPFVYNYFDDRKNEKHINDFDKEVTGDNPIYSEVTSENKRISDSVPVDFLSFTATSDEKDTLHQPDDGSLSYEPIKTNEWLQRRRSFMVNLHSGIGLNLRVNGNTKVGAGDIVIVNLRSPLINREAKRDSKDRYFRGNFLVTKIEHTFKLAGSKHEMQMTVMKDSMESPLPGGVNEEPRSVRQGNPEQTTSDSRTPAQIRENRSSTFVAGTPSKSQKAMIEKFENDPEFQAAWKRLKAKRPQVEKAEFYRVIYGESRGDHTIRNKASGTVGLFQFTRGTAKGLGTSVEEIGRMTPAQQVDVYSDYLRSYRGGGVGSLSVYGAAPGYAHRSDDTVVYKVGSEAWRINKSYRSAGGGPITVGSLKEYLTSKKYSA
tara:strand:+ start:399 stop:2396 length:1998 start_codon:yes stop_codon:yes gene_type:complete